MKLRQSYLPLLAPKLPLLLILVLFVFIAGTSLLTRTQAAILPARSLKLSDSNPGATNVTYNFSFTIPSAETLGSIVLELCSNDPFPLTPCTPPPGLDMTGAVLATQTGQTGFSIDPSSTAYRMVLTRTPAAASPGTVSYVFTGVTNPSGSGSYYGRFVTYASDDASGAPNDYSGIAWVTNPTFSVSTEVPPYLLFCTAVSIPTLSCDSATGDTVNLGNFSRNSSAAGLSQFLVASNAGFGFSVTVNGTTMTSGINTIPALATQTFAAPGNSQFGMNLRANSLPSVGVDPVGPGTALVDPAYNTPDRYRFNSGDFVVSSPGSSDLKRFTATYIVNINAAQPAGRYNTTMTYICLASF